MTTDSKDGLEGRGTDQAPDDTDDDPEGEVALAEHPGGQRQTGPRDDEDESQAAAIFDNPLEGMFHGCTRVRAVLGKACRVHS